MLAPNNNLLNSITNQNNLFKNEAVKFFFSLRRRWKIKFLWVIFEKSAEKIFVLTAKKLSQRERARKFVDLEFNDHVSMLSSLLLFWGVSHTLESWNSSVFVTTSLLPPLMMLRSLFIFPLRRRRRNLSMSGMSLGFRLKLATFFYCDEHCRGYFMSTMFIV